MDFIRILTKNYDTQKAETKSIVHKTFPFELNPLLKMSNPEKPLS